jgi:uncharacterized protein YdcH (DUF465 family)
MSELKTHPPQPENHPEGTSVELEGTSVELEGTSVGPDGEILKLGNILKLAEIRSKLVSQLALQETAQETDRLNNINNKKLQKMIESLTNERDKLTMEKEEITKLMKEKVRVTDEYINNLLSQLQEGQDKYDNLEKGKCPYCPWTWIRTITNDQYLVYGLVGLLAIIGGSRILGR